MISSFYTKRKQPNHEIFPIKSCNVKGWTIPELIKTKKECYFNWNIPSYHVQQVQQSKELKLNFNWVLLKKCNPNGWSFPLLFQNVTQQIIQNNYQHNNQKLCSGKGWVLPQSFSQSNFNNNQLVISLYNDSCYVSMYQKICSVQGWILPNKCNYIGWILPYIQTTQRTQSKKENSNSTSIDDQDPYKCDSLLNIVSNSNIRDIDKSTFKIINNPNNPYTLYTHPHISENQISQQTTQPKAQPPSQPKKHTFNYNIHNKSLDFKYIIKTIPTLNDIIQNKKWKDINPPNLIVMDPYINLYSNSFGSIKWIKNRIRKSKIEKAVVLIQNCIDIDVENFPECKGLVEVILYNIKIPTTISLSTYIEKLKKKKGFISFDDKNNWKFQVEI